MQFIFLSVLSCLLPVSSADAGASARQRAFSSPPVACAEQSLLTYKFLFA